MPWVKDGKERRYEWPPIPEVRSSQQAHQWLQRGAVDYFELYEGCAYKACRRNRACSTADVACYKATEHMFRRAGFWPDFFRHLRERVEGAAPPLYDGYAQERRVALREIADWEAEAKAKRGKVSAR